MSKDIESLVAQEETRIGVGSPEFIQRHAEIMADLAEIERLNKEDKHAAT